MTITKWCKNLTILSLVSLTGCGGMGPSFNDMTKAYTASIEQHTRDTVLVNMMRAAYDMPMTFTDIPSVLGTGVINAQAGASSTIFSASPESIPGFFSAGAQSSYYFGAQLNTSRSFNFTLSSLDNEQFTKGFLAPIPLDNVHFFTSSNHLSQALFFTLLIDNIEIQTPGSSKVVFYNDPASPKYAEFQKTLYNLLDSGLTTEVTMAERSIGPVINNEQAVKLMSQMSSSLMGGEVFLKPIGKGNQTQYQLHAQRPVTRFCLVPPSDQNWIKDNFGPQILCKADTLTTGKASNMASAEPSTSKTPKYFESLKVKLRSTRDIFRFVGQVILLQTNTKSHDTITIRSINAANQWEEVPLLIVNTNSSMPQSQIIAEVDYFGKTYSVPLNNNGYSSVVFDLLSLLVTLNKIPGSIPASPGILIK
jgi:hypothetical protein